METDCTLRVGFKALLKSIACTKAVKFVFAFLKHFETLLEVLWHPHVHGLLVFDNGGGWIVVYRSFYTIMLISASVTYISRVAQDLLKTINNTLLIYNRWLCFLTFNSSRSIFRLTHTGCNVVYTFKLRSGLKLFPHNICWSSCCWSQTFKSTKLLMVELTRCLGYFKRENTVFTRSHSSEKFDQYKDIHVNHVLDRA